MRILILEDDVEDRVPHFRYWLTQKPDVTLVFTETADEAIRALQCGEIDQSKSFDLIFLDHDLGGEQMVGTEGKNTGSEVVRWMVANLRTYCPVIIHSLNYGAAVDMKQKLEDMAMECYRIPYSELKHKLKDPSFITQ